MSMSNRVNAVDVIYAAMPVYLYFNPEILGYLLSPLLEYQESSQYSNPYAAQDLGEEFLMPIHCVLCSSSPFVHVALT